MVPSLASFVVRPTPWSSWYYLALPGIIVVTSALFVVTNLGASEGRRLGAIACFVLALLFTPFYFGLSWLFVRNSALELTDDALVKTNWRGAKTVIDRAAIARILRLAVDRSGASRYSNVVSYWVFESADEKALAIVNRSFWLMGDVEMLVGRLGVPVEGSWNEVLKPGEVRHEVRGVASWFDAHPWLSMIAAVAGTVLVAIVLISVFGNAR